MLKTKVAHEATRWNVQHACVCAAQHVLRSVFDDTFAWSLDASIAAHCFVDCMSPTKSPTSR
ncbi:hypothetical protein RESH_02346 [Rhodopirellula europaea SH398]|uniref:Uncharacterized protein n=1 Tax=Rhodopirellula europaea SH398 TaxID=1263868 RepID=M5SH52_9BACT|nr:hypothetical protein RESH_02346 [Rhodopirellula europaea SH398]